MRASSAVEDPGDSGALPESCPCDRTEWDALVGTGASSSGLQYRIGITSFNVNNPPFGICDGMTPDWPTPGGDGPHVRWDGKMGARVNQCQWTDTHLAAGFPAPSFAKHSYLDSPVVPGVRNEISVLLKLGELNWWIWLLGDHGYGGATIGIYAKSVGPVPTGTYAKVDPGDFYLETDGNVPNHAHCDQDMYDAQPGSITLAWTV